MQMVCFSGIKRVIYLKKKIQPSLEILPEGYKVHLGKNEGPLPKILNSPTDGTCAGGLETLLGL